MIKLKEFWKWFNPNEDVYEFRIKNFILLKHIAIQLGLNYSASGIYFSTLSEYQKLISMIKGRETVWLSVNSKKPAINKWGRKGFNGLDVGIESLNYLFIDIDPKHKNQGERIDKLKNMYKFVEILLKDLKTQNIKDCCVICSGYGWQILIKLDIPLLMPDQVWDKENKVYILDSNFEKYKVLAKKTFLDRVRKIHNKTALEYDCDIDASASNIGRVFAAPGTDNIKYNKSVPRKVVMIGKEPNTGLADWLLDELDNIKQAPVYNSSRVSKNIAKHFQLNEKNLIKNELVQFILKNDLPSGGGNNLLIFSLKCLIKDNSINFNSEVVKHLSMLIDRKWNTTIAFNCPDNKYHFNPNVVLTYCVLHRLPLLYKSYYEYKAVKPRDIKEHIFTMENYKAYPGKIKMQYTEGDLYKTLIEIKKEIMIITDDTEFMKILYSSLKFVEDSYGSKDVKYIFDEVAKYFFQNLYL